MRVAAGTLTLSFWKEWRKFPPSSPSSRGVPGGLLMPLMLLGEFCRERRGGEPVDPQSLPRQTRKKAFRWRGLGDGAGWGRVGTVREETPNTHSLLEVHLCHLTLQGRKNPIQFLAYSSVEGPSNSSTQIPQYFCTENVPSWQYLSIGIFLWS